MHDAFGLFFAILNVALSLISLILVTRAVKYFKEGLLARTLRRGTIVAILLCILFILNAAIATGILPAITPLDDVVGTVFILSLLYLAQGFINDWKNLE